VTSASLLRRLRAAIAACAVFAAATTASAQGYVVESATGKIEARPPSAKRVDVDSSRDEKSAAFVKLPFAFAYFGRPFRGAIVSAHGWLRPVDAPAFGATTEIVSTDGAIQPLATTYRFVGDGSSGAGDVWTWTSGAAPARRFVVSWENVSVGTDARVVVQAQLHEGAGRIVFAYKTTAAVTGGVGASATYACGLDEPDGKRVVAPTGRLADNRGLPPSDFVLDPRTVLFNAPSAPRVGTDVTWQKIRRESLPVDDSGRMCCYVAKGTGWFFVPDRAPRPVDPKRRDAPSRLDELVAEDKADFHGQTGDALRWVRQVFDAKATLVLRDGSPVRFWFRVVEYFSIDEKATAGPDDHVWSLRRMLSRVFPADDPRSKIENYAAWRAAASGRLTVVKLFAADQKDDAGPQFSSNRKNEYVLWRAMFKVGARGAMPDHDFPPDGWTPLPLFDENEDRMHVQHAEKADVREVVDPEYVDGRYEYVARNEDDPTGWVNRAKSRLPAMTDEAPGDDPSR
jgi:hypothetical protein